MTVKSRVVQTLLTLYPRAWRDEYGLEFSEILLGQPLTARIVANVIWSAAWQRGRAAAPSTIFGLGAMLVVLAELIANIVVPESADHWPAALLQDAHMTLPRVIVAPLAPASQIYVLCLIACGCCTTLRRGTGSNGPVGAAVKMTLIAGIPVMMAGALMLLGVLHLNAVGPGDLRLASGTHGLAYTYYSSAYYLPSRLSILVAPLFALGPSIIWGWLGGRLADSVLRRRHRRAHS